MTHAGVPEVILHWFGHISEITKEGFIDKISPPGLTVKILQIVCTLLHKIIHIIL